MKRLIYSVLIVFFSFLYFLPHKELYVYADTGNTTTTKKEPYCSGDEIPVTKETPIGSSGLACCKKKTPSGENNFLTTSTKKYNCNDFILAINLSSDDWNSAFESGQITAPSYCGDNFTFVNDPSLETKRCVQTTYNFPTQCSDFGFSNLESRIINEPSGITTASKPSTCCIRNYLPSTSIEETVCNTVTSCAEGLLKKSNVDGGTCTLGYLFVCDSWHTLTGNKCNIDKSKLPTGSTSFFSGTDFSGKCGSGFVDTAIGCVPTENFQGTLGFVLKWLFLASGGIISFLVIKNGYTLLTSAGNPEKLKSVKESAVSIISGILLIIFSLTILRIVGADILGLPGF